MKAIKGGKNKVITFLVSLLLFYPVMALAGPGGKIAIVVAGTFWGKVILVGLIIFFLPLIIYILIKQFFAKIRVYRDLRFVANICPAFEWIKLRERIKDCFHRVHAAWEKSDISEAKNWMTDWYWQNQQMVYLDRWERDGLVNICEVYKVNYIKPIFFSYRGDDGKIGNGSSLAVLISANMMDYLETIADRELIEGIRKKRDIERIWSFTYENEKWVVSNIDEGFNSLEYIEMMESVPKVQETLKFSQDVGPTAK